MPDLASLAKISGIDSPVARIVSDLKLSRTAQSILDEHNRYTELLEPYIRHAKLVRSLSEPWVATLNAIAPQMALTSLAGDFAAESLKTAIQPGLYDALHALRSMAHLTDSVKTVALGSHLEEIARIAESMRFPHIGFGSPAMRAFVERDEALHTLLSDSLDSDLGEPEGEIVEDVAPEASRAPEAVPGVIVRPFPTALLRALRIDPNGLHSLTPEQFELLIADRLDHMGFNPVLTGGTNRSDGGIDIIAVPRKVHAFGCLIAVQCEHHSGTRKTGRSKGRDLLEWKNSQFQLGVLVTNTTFTEDVRFAACQPHNRGFLRLREFGDVVRWIQDNYDAAMEWAEIPDVIELAPGYPLRLPKPRA